MPDRDPNRSGAALDSPRVSERQHTDIKAMSQNRHKIDRHLLHT